MVRVTEVVETSDPPKPDKPAAKTAEKKAPTKPPKAPKKTAAESARDAALLRFNQRSTKRFGLAPKRGSEFAGYEVIPTSSPLLDYKLGIGGIPLGRMTDFWGRPSTYKSTMALRITGEAQRRFPDKLTAWIDVENSWDPLWAAAQGVDTSSVIVVQANDLQYAEQQFDMLYDLTTSGMLSLAVLDSFGAMLPKEEFDKDADEASVGTMAKLITRAVKKILPKLPEQRMAFIGIDQVREIIGPRGGQTTSGGNAKKHAASLSLYFRDAGDKLVIMESDGKEKKEREVGKAVAVKIEKSKVSPPGAIARLTVVHMATAKYGPVGLDKVAEAYSLGKLTGVIEQGGGGYYTLPCGERIRGEDKVLEFLRDTPDEVEAIRTGALETVSHTVVDDYPELHVDGEPGPAPTVDLDDLGDVEEAPIEAAAIEAAG